MIRSELFDAAFLAMLIGYSIHAQQQPTPSRMEVGRLANGATVALVHPGAGEWGIETAGGTTPP